MTAPVADALPYGMRDIKLTSYTDAIGSVLSSTSVDLPYIQTLNFTEAEEYSELRGDDKLITTRGRGSNVNWDLEAGGLSITAWAVFTGGSVIERGLTPNRTIELQKKATTARPWFRIDGKIISDSGGDVLVRIYRCRANGDITANFANGEFQTSQVTGVGYPLLDDTNDLLYSIFRRETAAVISLTPDPNPVPVPSNLAAGAKSGTTPNISQVLTWSAVTGATGYKTQKSTNSGSTWAATTVQPVGAATTVTETGIATGAIWFRVAATVGGIDSDWSPYIVVTA